MWDKNILARTVYQWVTFAFHFLVCEILKVTIQYLPQYWEYSNYVWITIQLNQANKNKRQGSRGCKHTLIQVLLCCSVLSSNNTKQLELCHFQPNRLSLNIFLTRFLPLARAAPGATLSPRKALEHHRKQELDIHFFLCQKHSPSNKRPADKGSPINTEQELNGRVGGRAEKRKEVKMGTAVQQSGERGIKWKAL